MSLLKTILARKREEVDRRKAEAAQGALIRARQSPQRTHSLREVVSGPGIAIIAEIKKASPSKGIIRHDFKPAELARSYASGGASALSVLTDREFFQGSMYDLETVRESVDIPLLRKDFIIDWYQLYEARAAGADAVLLIVAALEQPLLCDLLGEAGILGLECLVEVHHEHEVDRALRAGATLLGLNNRDLATFRTDLQISVRLGKLIPDGCTVVAESGISSADDIRLLRDNGIHAFLIGEALMKMPEPGVALARLLSEARGDRP